MIDLARQGWRWMIVQGVLTTLFGLAASIWPNNTLVLLLILLAFAAIGGGLASMILMFTSKDNILAVVGLGLFGIACLVLGVVAIIWPPIVAVGLLVAIVLQALFAAVFLIVFGLRMRHIRHSGGWWTIIPGIIACAIVPAILIWGGSATTGAGDVVGAYASIEGIVLIVAGLLIPRELRDAPQTAVAAR